MKDVFWGIDKPTWAIIGAIAAVAVPMAYNMVNEIIKAKRERKYVEVQLIFLLNKFASGCVEVAWDDGYPPDAQKQGRPKTQHEIPVLGLSSVRGEHKFLKANLLKELHSIEIMQLQIQQKLREIDFQNDDPEESAYYDYRRRQYAELGIFTATLNKKICQNLRLAEETMSGNQSESCRRSLALMNRNRADSRIRKKYNKSKLMMKTHLPDPLKLP